MQISQHADGLKKSLFLYVDASEESKAAEVLLRSRGVPIHVIEGCLDEGWKYPLVQFHPWEFEGIEEIKNLISLLETTRNPEHDGLIIRWDLVRTDKPLDEITAADVPPGLDVDDMCALNPDGSLLLTRFKS